jgi:hypothetical protein
MEIAQVLLHDMQKSGRLALREAQAIDYVAKVIAEIQSVSRHPASCDLRDMPLAVDRPGRGPGCVMWSPCWPRTTCHQGSQLVLGPFLCGGGDMLGKASGTIIAMVQKLISTLPPVSHSLTHSLSHSLTHPPPLFNSVCLHLPVSLLSVV